MEPELRPAALLLAAALEATIAELRGMAYAAEDNAPGLRIMFDLQN